MPGAAHDPMAGPTEPSAAERARTALRLSGPLVVHAVGAVERLIGLHAADADGSPLLVLPTDDPLVEAVRRAPAIDATTHAPALDLPAIVEARDPYPVPQRASVRTLRDEPSAWVRIRLWLAGWLSELYGDERREAAVMVAARSPVGELLDVGSSRTVLRLEPGQVLVGTGETLSPLAGDAIDVDPEAFAAAVPDLLADHEAAHLAHLADDHPDELVLLCQLLDPRLREEAVGIVPGRLDRYGLELCVRTAAGSHQARLSFPAAITHVDQLPGAMQALLRRAAACCGGPG
jgi:hypothetical protein